jgi:methyl-accepting chemotaxis protein
MPFSFQFRDLRVKILMLAAGGVLATGVVGGFELLQMRNALRDQASTDQQALARTFAAVVTEHLSTVQGIAVAMSGAPAVRTPLLTDQIQPAVHGVPADADTQRRATLHAGVDAGGGAFTSLAVWAVNGDAYLFEPFERQVGQPKPNYSDSSSFQNATKSNAFAWGAATVSSRDGSIILTFATPIKDAAGHPTAILGGAMDLTALAKATSAFKVGQTGQVLLFDQLGMPLVYPDPQRIQDVKPLTDQPLVAQALANRPGFLAYHNPLTNADEVGTIVKLDNGMFAAVTQDQSEAFAGANDAQRLFLAVLAACLLALGLLAWLIQRSIGGSVRTLAQAAAGLARGDVDQEINQESGDDLGRMATAFRELIGYQRGMAEVADAMAEGDLSHEVEPLSERDRLGQAFQRMTGSLRELVGQVQATAEQVAGASHELGQSTDEVGLAAQRVSAAAQTVTSSAGQTSRSAQDTNLAVAQLGQAIDGIARGASEQARQVQVASATATHMAAVVEQVAASAQGVATATQETQSSAESGAAAVRQTVAGMADIKAVVSSAAAKVVDLGKLSEKIGVVVETIDDIAEQPNLLALNAAIEAARAGEHGKGFAVVADEVRKLAERSGRETKAIAELIRDVQSGTHEAVGAMESGAARVEQGSAKADQAGQALEAILSAVEATVRQVSDIASAAQDMTTASRQVTEVIGGISAVVEENAAATEHMATQSQQVAGAIESISTIATDQSHATEEVTASAGAMSAQVTALRTRTRELADSAERLRQLVARFKLQDDQPTLSFKEARLRRAA